MKGKTTFDKLGEKLFNYDNVIEYTDYNMKELKRKQIRLALLE